MSDFKPLKIVHFTKHFHPVWGGLERFIHGLIINTTPTFHHEIWCYNDDLEGNKNKLENASSYDGIQIHRVQCKKLGRFHFGNFPLESIQSADIIHVHNMDILLDQILLLLFRAKLKIPVVVSTHGLIFHHERGKTVKNIYLNLANRVRKSQIKLVLASGSQDYDWLRKNSPFLPVTHFPNPLNVSPENLFPDKRESCGILFISRAQQSKRIDLVFHLFSELRQEGFSDPLTLILSGSKSEISGLMDAYHHQVREGRIEVLTNISELEKWNLLKERKLYLNPSLYEGFGYSIFEALVSNCLTLVTREVFRNFVGYNFPNLFSATDFSDLKETTQTLIRLNKQPVTLAGKNFRPPVNLVWQERKHELERFYTSLITA